MNGARIVSETTGDRPSSLNVSHFGMTLFIRGNFTPVPFRRASPVFAHRPRLFPRLRRRVEQVAQRPLEPIGHAGLVNDPRHLRFFWRFRTGFRHLTRAFLLRPQAFLARRQPRALS